MRNLIAIRRAAARRLLPSAPGGSAVLAQYAETLNWYSDTSGWGSKEFAYTRAYLCADRREIRLMVRRLMNRV